jgi:hypothetical protein
MRRIIDSARHRRSQRKAGRLPAGFAQDIDYWERHLSSWDGRQRWHGRGDPFVFASDASTSGWGFVLESAPAAARALLPVHLLPGAAKAGVWSPGEGHAPLFASHTNIALGELFVPVAIAAMYGAHLEDSHALFVLDNDADVNVINRQRARDPKMAQMLRALADSATRHNFSYSAVHRRGTENVLPDVCSRPEKHKFRLDPASLRPLLRRELETARHSTTSQAAIHSSFGAFSVSHAKLHELVPLIYPRSVSLCSSRGLVLPASGEGASWNWPRGSFQ